MLKSIPEKDNSFLRIGSLRIGSLLGVNTKLPQIQHLHPQIRSSAPPSAFDIKLHKNWGSADNVLPHSESFFYFMILSRNICNNCPNRTRIRWDHLSLAWRNVVQSVILRISHLHLLNANQCQPHRTSRVDTKQLNLHQIATPITLMDLTTTGELEVSTLFIG